MKVYSTVSGRRAVSDLRECEAKGHIDNTPHYNSVFHHLASPALTPILKAIIEESAAPLKAIETDFAVDSSGFATSTFDRWYDAKYGKMRSDHKWIKAHLMIGVKTNIVTSVEVTGPDNDDYSYLPPLLETTAKRFNVVELSADKGYIGASNIEAVVKAGPCRTSPSK